MTLRRPAGTSWTDEDGSSVATKVSLQKLTINCRKVHKYCMTCIRSKSLGKHDSGPLSPVFVPNPLNVIAMDLYKLGVTLPNGYRYVLVIIDTCTS